MPHRHARLDQKLHADPLHPDAVVVVLPAVADESLIKRSDLINRRPWDQHGHESQTLSRDQRAAHPPRRLLHRIPDATVESRRYQSGARIGSGRGLKLAGRVRMQQHDVVVHQQDVVGWIRRCDTQIGIP